MWLRADCNAEARVTKQLENFLRTFIKKRGIAAYLGQVYRWYFVLILTTMQGYWVAIAVFGWVFYWIVKLGAHGRKSPQVSLCRKKLLINTLFSLSTDWALYEGLKTMAIPGYNPYTSSAKPKGSETEEIELAARYAATSAMAMSLSAMITNPIEVVRTRWQTSGGDVDRPKSIVSMMKQMWKQAGWRAFMRGGLVRGLYYVS